MKYLKLFERFDIIKDYMLGDNLLMIGNVLNYLNIIDQQLDQETELESAYDVNVIDFFKEIFLGKKIVFKSVNKPFNDPQIEGIVNDIGTFYYKSDIYIKVKLSNSIWLSGKPETESNKDWFLVKNNSLIAIYDYDADSKPLHKEVKIKKEGEKYNL